MAPSPLGTWPGVPGHAVSIPQKISVQACVIPALYQSIHCVSSETRGEALNGACLASRECSKYVFKRKDLS